MKDEWSLGGHKNLLWQTACNSNRWAETCFYSKDTLTVRHDYEAAAEDAAKGNERAIEYITRFTALLMKS